MAYFNEGYGCQCSRWLKAKKAKINCLCSQEIITDKLCAQHVDAQEINVNNENANHLCVSQVLRANDLQAESVTANNLCASQGRMNNLCVNNLRVANLDHCQKWRAAVTFSNDFTYTLGDPLNWTTVLDDPNANIALAPFGYTVPQSGYYSFNFHLDTSNLQGSTVIAGQPISVLSVFRNGIEIIDNQTAFLTFTNGQSANLSGLLVLNAGDIITMSYEIFVVDPGLGLASYVGTITIEGDGSFSGRSFFDIHHLSSLDCPAILCPPCEPMEPACEPVEVNCENPCFNEERDC